MRRYGQEPGLALPPLRTAEPSPVTEAEHAELHAPREAGVQRDPSDAKRALAARYEQHAAELDGLEQVHSGRPEWIGELEQDRPAFRERLADLRSRRVPEPDPDFGDQGPAWPPIGPDDRDAIMQPPVPQMPPAPGLAPEAGLEAGQ
jgi:hypothetical protein